MMTLTGMMMQMLLVMQTLLKMVKRKKKGKILERLCVCEAVNAWCC